MRSSQSTPGCGGRGTPAAISRRSRQPSSACTWRSCAWIPPGRAASAGPTGGRPRSTPSTSPSTAACPQAGTRPYKISYTEDLTDPRGWVEDAVRVAASPGDLLIDALAARPLRGGPVTSDVLVLLLGEKEARVPLPWGVPRHLG